MLRFCRSRLCFETIDAHQAAAGSAVDVQYGSTAGACSQLSPVPLGSCFDNAQHLNEQVQVQFQALLAQLQPCHLLRTAAAQDASRALSPAEAAQTNPSTAHARGQSLVTQQQDKQHHDDSEVDATQDSQANEPEAVAAAAPTNCPAQPVHSNAAAIAVQEVREAVPAAEAAVDVGAAVQPAATVWPSMIPETCWEFSMPAIALPLEASEVQEQQAIRVVPAEQHHSSKDSSKEGYLQQATASHVSQQKQQEPDLGAKETCPVLPDLHDSMPAKQDDLQKQHAVQQQHQRQHHASDTHDAVGQPILSASADAVAADSMLQAQQSTKQPALRLETPTHSSSYHTGPQLHLQPARSATITPTAEQMVGGKQQRQTLAPSSAGNASRAQHAVAAAGNKGKQKLSVLDQLAALPAKKPKTAPPPAAAAAAARSGEQQQEHLPAPEQQQQPQAQYWQGHQQLQRQHHPGQQQWQHFQSMQQHQQPWAGQQQQPQQQMVQEPITRYKPAGLRPPQQHQQQQRHFQQQQQQPAPAGGHTDAAKAYRQKTTFKCPRPMNPASAMGRGTGAAVISSKLQTPQASSMNAAAAAAAHQTLGYDETAGAASDAEQEDPLYKHMLAVAAAAAPDDGILFVTCGGKKLEMSETAKARTAALLAEADAVAKEAAVEEELPTMPAAAATDGKASEQHHNQAVAAVAATEEDTPRQEPKYSQQQDTLDPAVQAACARFQAQIAGGPTEGLGFVNMRGNVQVSATAAATSARYLQIMQEAEAAETAAITASRGGAEYLDIKADLQAVTAHATQGQASAAVAASGAAAADGIQQQEPKYSQQYNALDPAVQAACARFQAQIAGGPAEGFGFVNLHGNMQVSTAAAATSARYLQFMQEAEAEAANSAAANGVLLPHGSTRPAAAPVATKPPQQPALAAASSVGSKLQPPNKLGIGRGSGAFKPPRPVAPKPAAAAAAAAPRQAQQLPPLEQQPPALGHWQQQQQHWGMQGYQQPLVTGQLAASDTAAAAGGSGSGTQGGSSMANSQELASLDRLMEAADRYAAEHAAARAAAAGAATVVATVCPQVASPAGDLDDISGAAAAPAPEPSCDGIEPPGRRLGIRAAAAAVAAAASLHDGSAEAAEALAAETAADQGAEVNDADVAEVPPSLTAADAPAADLSISHAAAESGSTSQSSVATGSTSCAGGSTLERQISDASGGVVSETLAPDEGEQQQQLQAAECEQAEELQDQQHQVCHVTEEVRQQQQQEQEQELIGCQQARKLDDHQQQFSGVKQEVREQKWQQEQQHDMLEVLAPPIPLQLIPNGNAVAHHEQQQQQCLMQEECQSAPQAVASGSRPERSRKRYKLLPVQIAAAAAGPAVLSPYPGLIWASGEGMLLSKPAAARGQAFVERLQHMALLPSSATAATTVGGRSRGSTTSHALAEESHTDVVAVDVLVAADGTLQLILVARSASVVLLPAAATGAALAASAAQLGCSNNRASNKRAYADMAAAAPQTISIAGVAEEVGPAPVGVVVEDLAAAAPAGLMSVQPPVKRLPQGAGGNSASMQAPAAELPCTDVLADAVVAETPAEAPAAPPAAAVAAAAGPVLHSPSPSPAKGRKLSFSAAAFITPLPATKATTARGTAAAAAVPPIPETPTSSAAVAADNVVAETPVSDAAVAARGGVIPATPLTGDTSHLHHHQQQPSTANMPFEQQKHKAAGGRKQAVPCDDAGVAHLDPRDCVMAADTLVLQQQQSQTCAEAVDAQPIGDTMVIGEHAGVVGRYQPLADTLELQQDEEQQQQQQQQQPQQQEEEVEGVALQQMVLDDTLVLEPDEQEEAEGCVREEVVCEAGDTLVIAQSQPDSQQQQQQQQVPGVTDTLVLDPAGDECSVPEHHEQQQVLDALQRHTFAAAAVAVGDTMPLDDVVAEQQQLQHQQHEADIGLLAAAVAAGGIKRSHEAMSAAAGSAAAVGGVAGLQTAGGRRVTVGAVQLEAFRNRIGWTEPQQQHQHLISQQQQQQRCEQQHTRQQRAEAAEGDDRLEDGPPSKRHSLSPADHGSCQQQQQQQGLAAGSTAVAALTTGSGKKVTVDPVALAAYQQKMGGHIEQQQHAVVLETPTAGAPNLVVAGFSTSSGKNVTVDTAVMAAYQQKMGLLDVQQPQQEQQQQQQQQQQEPAVQSPAAVPAPAGFPGLSTASGKKVTVEPASLAAFNQRMGVFDVQQQQQQQQEQQEPVLQPTPAAPAAADFPALSSAGGRRVEVNPAAALVFKQKMGVLGVQHSHHQQQQQEPTVQPTPAAAPGNAGLSTASGRKVTLNPAAMQVFNQRMGVHAIEQQQQQGPVVQPAPAAAPAPAPFAALSTASGRTVTVDPAAAAACNQKMGVADAQQQQQQQEPPAQHMPAAAAPAATGFAGLSTAGGKKVTVDPAAMAAFKQQMGMQEQHPHQQPAEEHQQRHQHDQVPPAPAAGPPSPSPLPQAAAVSRLRACKPPPAPTAPATAATPMSAPRIMTRKRQLPAQQQQQQRTGGKKAFKLPVKPGSTAVDTAAAIAGRTGLSGQQQQQQQTNGLKAAAAATPAKQPKERGLPVAGYFALARAKRAAAAAGGADAPGNEVLAGDASAAPAGVDTEQWVAFDLPTTPDQAAAFKFVAAAPKAAQQQQPPGPDTAAGLLEFQSAAAGLTSSAAAAAFGSSRARQQLISWGADADKATSAWVSNHYKWIVWKLAAYDRKLLAADSNNSSSAAAGEGRSVLQHPDVCCLTVSNVMQQLQKRYTAEMVEGQRSVLRKILEQDLPAGVPIVLMVSAIRTSGCSSSKPEQQQQGEDGSGVAAAAAVSGDVTGIQLSDGWYYINATVDAPLIELIGQGKIQVGSKLRVVGSELRSDRPADPLEAAKWALLRIWYNGSSPAAWDEKLGPVSTGQTLRALSRVHPAGGLVPRLLLLVQRCYPLLYYCRSSRRYYTRKQYDAAERKAEKQREQVMQAAAAAAQQAELEQCKLWASSRTASSVEKAYAAAVLGSCDDGISNTVTPGQLQLLRSQRESHMEQQRQQHTQRLLVQANSSNPSAAAAAASSSADVSNWSLEPPVPVQRFRVSGVVPKGVGPVWGCSQAMIRVWRASNVMQGMDEGSVVLATGLQAGSDGRSSFCDIEWQGGGRMLELSSGKNTSWQVLGPSSTLAAHYDMEPWHSRHRVKVGSLTESTLRTEFDFVGVLLFAGEVMKGPRECHQWIFLAGDKPGPVTAAADTAAAGVYDQTDHPQQQQHTAGNSKTGAAGAAGTAGPSVLAVKLVGSETAVDWLEPTVEDSSSSSFDAQQQQTSSMMKTPAAANGGTVNSNTSVSTGPNRASSRRFITAKQQPQQQVRETVVSCSNLILLNRDHGNNMWVATAHDTAVVAVLSGTAVGSRAEKSVQEVLTWAKQEQQMLVHLKQQMRKLVQG